MTEKTTDARETLTASSAHPSTPASLRIGLSSVCITPEEPIWLYGYASPPRRTPFTGKVHDVYAKTIAFEDAEGARSVLITVDICVLRKPQYLRALSAISECTGLPPERIIINLSHTHSGPMVGAEDPNRWPLPPDMMRRIEAYTERLFDLLAESAASALSELQPARLSWGRGRAGFVRNRRIFDDEGRYVGMKPNPDGFTDPRVTVLRIERPDGTLRGLVGSLACHAVTLGPANLRLCGDYPGFAKEFLEAELPGVEAFFMQGCGADANTHPRAIAGQMNWARSQGAELAAEIERVAEEDLKPVHGPIRAAQTWVELPLRLPSRKELETRAAGPDYQSHNAKRLLAQLDRGETPAATYRTVIGLWRFGNDLTLAALPGETVSGYIPRLERIFDPERLWIAGYCNDVFGYLPTAQIVREGGFEDRGILLEPGLFDAGAEEVVARGVEELARQVGALEDGSTLGGCVT